MQRLSPNFKRTLQIAVTSATITSVFMYLFYYQGWQSVLAGISIGGTIPLVLAWYTEIIVKKYLSGVPLILLLFLNTVANLFIIIAIAIFFVGIFYYQSNFVKLLSNPENILNRYYYTGMAFGLALSLFFNFFSILDTLIGKKMLGRLFVGLYRHPREVERAFMFVDINNSTAIAEKIGHLKFMSMVNDFVHDLTLAVQKTKGEIYKYVGDEAIISWKISDAIKNNNCIACFVHFEHQIKSRTAYYQSHYNMVPSFKAGLHCGPAVIGELGYTKREIAFMGDTLNTTARIEQACTTYQKTILISEALVYKLNHDESLSFAEVGNVVLRGKEEKTKLYTLIY